MVHAMKANGAMIRPTDKANWFMQTAMFTKVNGSTIKLRVRAPTHMQTELTTRGFGSMISNMGKEWRVGLMAHVTKVSTSKAKKKEKAA
jgi:hypothetical protein